jgi:hypothetical protein
MHARALRSLAAPLALALVVGVSACGGGGSNSGKGGTSSRTAPRPQVTLAAPTHRPAVGAPWPITIRAYDPGGRPLRAEVRYRFLFGGTVVARRSHYRFRGTFHDTLRWPARSAGLPLTFRAVVTTPLGKRNLDYRVRVRR